MFWGLKKGWKRKDVTVSGEDQRLKGQISIMKQQDHREWLFVRDMVGKWSRPLHEMIDNVSQVSVMLVIAPFGRHFQFSKISLKSRNSIHKSCMDSRAFPLLSTSESPSIACLPLLLPFQSPPNSLSPLLPSCTSLFPSLLIQLLQFFLLIIKVLYTHQNLWSAASVKCRDRPPLIHITQMTEVLEPTIAKKQVALPTRKTASYGDGFRKVELLTNHYQVKLTAFSKLVIFRVKIEPKIALDNRGLRQKLMAEIKPQLDLMIKNPVMSGFNIFSHEEAKTAKEKDFKTDKHIINVKQVKVYEVGENPKFLLHFLNNGLKNILEKLKYIEIGKTGKYFNCSKKKQIDNLNMYDGYKANFVKLNAGYFLRVDSVKKIVRNETVLQAIDNIYKKHHSQDKEERRMTVKSQLVGKIIMANYGVARYYKITDIHFRRIEDQKIEGVKTFPEYYQEKYNMTINKPEQPIIEVQTKKTVKDKGPCYLVPEFCLMTGIPDDFDEMRRKKVSEHAIKNPPEKVEEIQKLMDSMKDTDEIKALKDLGIDINTKMHKFSARTISVPTLRLGGKNSVDSGKQAFFNLFNKPIFNNKHDIACQIIYFRGTDVKPLLGVFKSTSQNLGVNMKVQESEVSGRNFKDLLARANQPHGDTNICLIVLPNNMKTDYKKLKSSTIQSEMVTQVITDATMRKKNLQSIATKVLLQIIAKRGNILWVPQTRSKLQKTMLLAFDTAKTTNGTLMSACATINSTFNSLFTTHRTFSGDKKYETMKELTGQCVNAYYDRNKCYPDEVVIFFNSCCGDQISLYHELYFDKLEEHFKESSKTREIHMIGIMVNTKTNERFFLDSRQVSNVQAGTLVSQGLVSDNYDFYIMSQQSNKGSTVPNHYKVIYNTSRIEQPQLQELIFSQCFNYVNWTGSIKVPAILQYAKKCAKFLSQVLEKNGDVPDTIKNKPYFV